MLCKSSADVIVVQHCSLLANYELFLCEDASFIAARVLGRVICDLKVDV